MFGVIKIKFDICYAQEFMIYIDNQFEPYAFLLSYFMDTRLNVGLYFGYMVFNLFHKCTISFELISYFFGIEPTS